MDEDVAQESAKIDEGQQINDRIHQDSQDPQDPMIIVIDSVIDFKAGAEQNITSNDIPEVSENQQ